MEIGGDILLDSKCKSTSQMLLDTLWIYLNPKPMNALHSEAQYMCTSIRHWVVERPDSMVVGNDVRFKRVNLTQDTYYLWSVDHIKTTNLSTYTPIENCYTPLTGSRPKSPRQSVNKHSNWVKAKGGN